MRQNHGTGYRLPAASVVSPSRSTRRILLSTGLAALACPVVGKAAAQPDPGQGQGLPRAFNLSIDHATANITGRSRPAVAINGQIPGPVLRFREGEEVTVTVANRLRAHTSIHWHGLILPSGQDGVPGISDGFQGIPPGETHQYRFPLIQSGTYWYHSHSGFQEQAGMYGPLIIDPVRPDPFGYDRDYIIQLSDWTDEDPLRVLQNLKRDAGYYNYNKRTLSGLVRDLAAAADGTARSAVIADRRMWGDMRMDPTDIEDVGGYTYLVNGRPPAANFTALYRPGETLRLRFINSSAMTHFDLRIPGLEMTVVQAHGNNVQPVVVEEMRIAPAETYDVLIRPCGDRQYAILAETMGRQGFASASLAAREGLPMLPLPPHRARPLLTMADMGGPYGPTGLDRGTPLPEVDRPGHVAPPMGMGNMGHASMPSMPGGAAPMAAVMPGMDHAAMGHGSMMAAPAMNHAAMGHAPATGHTAMDHGSGAGADPFANATGAPPGTRVLSLRDLRAVANPYPPRPPHRTIEVRLTGNMERYIWSINGNRFNEAQPLLWGLGERVRLHFINETMMNHPMHLHGMWMQPQLGHGTQNPLLHVVNIKPGSTLDVDVEADAEGGWAFHCHMLFHMEAGMMRKVEVRRQSGSSVAG